MTNTTPTQFRDNLVMLFMANYIDGQPVQQGQMIATSEVVEYIDEFVMPALDDFATARVIEELERHKDKRCICEESGTDACDSLWHHRNNIDNRIKELTATPHEGEETV